jgi:hypothetical protein
VVPELRGGALGVNNLNIFEIENKAERKNVQLEI